MIYKLSKTTKGKMCEEIARNILENRGYSILIQNYRFRKIGEIDIIALKEKTYCFIEVKSRQSLRFGLPSESVNFYKMQKLRKTAQAYLFENNLGDVSLRFDLVEIMFRLDKEKIELIEYNIIENFLD